MEFRLLCPTSRVDSFIGESGISIKELEQATNASIHVKDAPIESEDRIVSRDRVIVVTASADVTEKLVLTVFNEKTREVEGDTFLVSPAQKALIRVFERILDVAEKNDGLGITSDCIVSCRLLMDVSQEALAMRMGSKVMEQDGMPWWNGIGVSSGEDFGGPNDIVMAIMGDVLTVKKSLVAVSCCLQANPPVDLQEMIRNSTLWKVLPLRALQYFHQVETLVRNMGRNREVKFRILCSQDGVGRVRGTLPHDQKTLGVGVSYGNYVAGCAEQILTVTALEVGDIHCSPAQIALLFIFCRSIDRELDSGSNESVTARLVVPSSEVGFITGIEGRRISCLRQETGVNIQILGSDKVPKCVTENDQVVQISGVLDKELDSGSNKSVTARYVVPLSEVGRIAGSEGRRISYLRKETGAEIEILGSDKVPKCATENDQVVQISGVLENVIDALYRVTNILRRNILAKPSIGSSSLGWCNPYGLEGFTTTQPTPVDETMGSKDIGRVKRKRNRGGRYKKHWNSFISSGSGRKKPSEVEIVLLEHVIEAVQENLRQIEEHAKVSVRDRSPGPADKVLVLHGTHGEIQAAESRLLSIILDGSCPSFESNCMFTHNRIEDGHGSSSVLLCAYI